MSINLDGLKTGADKLASPALRLGGVMVDTTEKFVAIQMDSCKVYSDIAFRELKKIPEVKNMEQAGDLLWGQIEPFSEFNKQLLNDWKSLVALGTEFSQDVKRAFSSDSGKATETSPASTVAAAATTAKTGETKKSSTGKAKSSSRATKPLAVAE